MLNHGRITSEQTVLYLLVIWSEIADTHFMLEIHAYGARQQPSNTYIWHFSYGLAEPPLNT